ncbi:DNA-directed RNA polymerase I subunit RPA43 [Eufriesea mexicana]|uniref:DNA-directed RNA polymerase I subunit RPA43 n=1 Tax=Eufriesea mexicana TaxID=516756 RepID=A0A310SHG6_9HYME|nr:PREDICTED: spindle pole body component 110 [Eufriesea mexicana]OAD53725.1 DNA-directed RNA polymerase I subunit RPA43 [Eufriesea mexicana]
MKFKAYTGITWSVLELTGLVEDEDSHVYFEKFKKHLGLHPFHLTNLNVALNEILSSNLNSYDPDLKGFLLAYKNPKLLTPLGEIFHDTCFIHIDIEADFYVFKPEVGCTLKGIVNKKGLGHIGILVHKAFNVSISKPDDEENWPGDDLEIGQEVRFSITLLDFTSKLPFIRGVFNSNDYLRGCKLVQKSINNKRSSSVNKMQNDVENQANRISEKNVKYTKQRIFFATDSENTTDEDVSPVKEEIVQQKKSKKKSKLKESVEYCENKEKDKKYNRKCKEMNESRINLTKVEIDHDQYTNNLSLNGELAVNEELEEFNDSKSNIKKKYKIRNSQSEIDEDDNKKSITYLSNKILNESSTIKFKSNTSRIKVEHYAVNSDVEQIIDENIPESKHKIKKNSMKRQLLDDSDISVVDFSTEKYIKSSKDPSKRSSKRIKMEELNDSHIHEVNDIQESPKKQHKKHKHSLKLETSESEMDNIKKHSKRASILDSDTVIQNIKIKKEKITSSSENTQDEDCVETKNSGLNTSICDSNYDVGHKNNITEKKRKKHSKRAIIDTSTIKLEPEFEDVVIKIEPGFENVAVKIEKPENDSDNIIQDIFSEHDDHIDNDEGHIKSNVKHLKKKKVDKKVKIANVKVKTEKLLGTDVLDIDNSDVDVQNIPKRKQHKSSPHKQLNKSRESESDIEFRNVKIKTERFSDS